MATFSGTVRTEGTSLPKSTGDVPLGVRRERKQRRSGWRSKIILNHNVFGFVHESLATPRVAHAKTAAELLRLTKRGFGWGFA